MTQSQFATAEASAGEPVSSASHSSMQEAFFRADLAVGENPGQLLMLSGEHVNAQHAVVLEFAVREGRRFMHTSSVGGESVTLHRRAVKSSPPGHRW